MGFAKDFNGGYRGCPCSKLQLHRPLLRHRAQRIQPTKELVLDRIAEGSQNRPREAGIKDSNSKRAFGCASRLDNRAGVLRRPRVLPVHCCQSSTSWRAFVLLIGRVTLLQASDMMSGLMQGHKEVRFQGFAQIFHAYRFFARKLALPRRGNTTAGEHNGEVVSIFARRQELEQLLSGVRAGFSQMFEAKMSLAPPVGPGKARDQMVTEK